MQVSEDTRMSQEFESCHYVGLFYLTPQNEHLFLKSFSEEANTLIYEFLGSLLTVIL